MANIVRRDIHYNKLKNVCVEYSIPIDKISIKEKYGRYDITPNIYISEEAQEAMSEIERNSYDYCQQCGCKCKQYWTTPAVPTHYCLKHYIITLIKYIYKRIIQRISNTF